MSEDISLEAKREIVETWTTNMDSYIKHKPIERELKLGKDAFYRYKTTNRRFPSVEIEKLYNFLKKKALIRIFDIKNEDD